MLNNTFSFASLQQNIALITSLSTNLLGDDLPLTITSLTEEVQGLRNHNSIVSYHGGDEVNKFVLRIVLQQQDELYSHVREYEIMDWLMKQGYNICPRILYHDFSKSVIPFPFMVQEFIKGNAIGYAAYEPGFQTPEVLGKVADALKKIHSVPRDPKSTSEDSKKLIPNKNFAQLSFTQHSKFVSEEFCAGATVLCDQIIQKTEPHTAFFAGLVREQLVHGDAHYANVISLGEEYVFIDWEGAGTGTYLEDIGTFIASNINLTPELEKLFLEKYKFDNEKKENVLGLWLYKIRRLITVVGYLGNAMQDCSEHRKKFFLQGMHLFVAKCGVVLNEYPHM